MQTPTRRFALLAFAALLATPAWAERLDPVRSVVAHAEDLQFSIDFPEPKTGDLYIAANVGGALYFYTDQGWSQTPRPREYGQTYQGAKPVNLGNSAAIAPGVYPIYQVIVASNAADVYDTRNWVGGLSALGQANLQINLPAQVSGDFNGDGWADDDANHDSYHDDDLNHDGYHDDDKNHDGYHDDDLNHDGQHDGGTEHPGGHD